MEELIFFDMDSRATAILNVKKKKTSLDIINLIKHDAPTNYHAYPNLSQITDFLYLKIGV